MSAAKHIPELDKKGLRQFGITTGAIIAGLFGIVLPWMFNAVTYPTWPWIVFAVLAVWGIVAPTTLRPVYRGWMRFGLLISKVTTPLIMGLVFLLVITPTALIMKIIRRDAMARKFDDAVATYRINSKQSDDPDSLKRPF